MASCTAYDPTEDAALWMSIAFPAFEAVAVVSAAIMIDSDDRAPTCLWRIRRRDSKARK